MDVPVAGPFGVFGGVEGAYGSLFRTGAVFLPIGNRVRPSMFASGRHLRPQRQQ